MQPLFDALAVILVQMQEDGEILTALTYVLLSLSNLVILGFAAVLVLRELRLLRKG